MAELKTKQTDADVRDFILSFANTEQKQQDSFELLKLMQDCTGSGSTTTNPNAAGRKATGCLSGFRPGKLPFHCMSIATAQGRMSC